MSNNTRDEERDGLARRRAREATERDTRLPRQFVETLVQAWIRDAAALGADAEGGVLLAHAAEAVEFGVGDADRAVALYERAARHTDADPRAFAGLRRSARGRRDLAALATAWEDELDAARLPYQRVLAAVGLAGVMLRGNVPVERLLALVDECESQLSDVPAEVIALWRAVREDALIRAGRGAEALRSRVERRNDLALLGSDAVAHCSDRAALAAAGLASVLGAPPNAVLAWYEAAFESRRSPEAARPLVRAAFDSADLAHAEAILTEAARAADDASTRALFLHELGRIRAHRLNDRSGGLTALGEALKAGRCSPASAMAFVAMARAAQQSVVADELVDALGASLEFAASGVERADLLTQMAVRFDRDLSMIDAAIDMAREALDEVADFKPAMRLLSDLYARRGAWAAWTMIGETELQTEHDAEERLRLHDRLAEVYVVELQDPASAERHLRAALEHRAYAPALRRLSRLLTEQYRWDELHEVLVATAERLPGTRDRLAALELAADVAEHRLRDSDRAASTWLRIVRESADAPTATASLIRILEGTERWDELLDALELEARRAQSDRPSRVSILCRAAEVARRRMGDLTAAEEYFRRALDEDAACDEALRGLGSILHAQERWDELVAMTERELVASRHRAHRRRCLRSLGELYAARVDNAARAIDCFAELAETDGRTREEALIWLDRLHQAAQQHEERVGVLRQRFDAASDAESRGRLAFRIGEVLEWELDRLDEAFDFYVESLSDATASPLGVAGIDRLWNQPAVSSEQRHEALRCIRAMMERDDEELRAIALEFIAERAGAIVDDAARHEARRLLATSRPDRVAAAEAFALSSLLRGDFESFELARELAPATPVEEGRARWAALDSFRMGDELPLADLEAMPLTLAMLARETGAAHVPFPGSHERDLFGRIGRGVVSVADLRTPDDSETGLRLGVLAGRALGERDTVRRCFIALADSFEHPARAMRAWLDLAAEEGAGRDEKCGWLERAADLGCFEPTLRDELYSALAGVFDLESLQRALATHIAHGAADSVAAARLAHRRARVLEALGRRDEALEVLRYASIHAPADADIALDKAKLESVAERLDEARGTLEDCLDAGITGADRIEVLGRLAALHQSAGGDRQRALAALEEAFTVSEHTAEWGTRLGNAHAQFGDPARAAEVLEKVLVVPAAADDVRHWLTLARLYHRRLDRAEEAEKKLWTLFETFPDQRPVLAALEELYRAGGNGRAFAEKLAETLQSGRLRVAESVLGDLWSYLGELNMSVLERFGEAEQAFARARALLGADASTVLREAQAVARQKGRGRDAVRLVVDSLVLAPAEVGFWEEASAELEARAVEVGDAARVRVARQMRALFGARVEIEDEQVRRDPTRELGSATAWSLLGVDWMEHELREAMRGAAPLADRVIGRDIPGRREIRTRRYRREEFSAFDAYLAGASHWLGVDIPRVAVSDDVTGATVLDGGLFAVHPSSIAEDEPIRSRFWAGWIAGVAFTQIGAWVGASDDDVRDMLSAVASRGLGLDGYDASRFGDEIGGLLHMAARRTAAAALRDRMRVLDLDLEGSADAAARFGDRCGLVLCGDLRVAVEEIAAAVGRPGSLRDAHAQEFIVEHPRTLDVLRFAARDEYFQARYESGLGQRPRLFE